MAARPVPERRRHADAAVQHARFLAALLAGDPHAAERAVADAMIAGMPGATVHAEVIAPAMHEIGEQWARAELAVAHEHIATAIAHGVLARMYPSMLAAPPGTRPLVLVAAVEGERHALATRMVADALEGAGHRVLLLGADVPTDALVEATMRHRPVAVLLSATLSTSLPALDDAIERVRALPGAPAVIVGGQAIAQDWTAPDGVQVIRRSDDALVAVESTMRDWAPGLADPVEWSPMPGRPAPGPIEPESTAGEVVVAAADLVRDFARRTHVLEALAFRDALTGAWNRRAFDDRLAEVTDDLVRGRGPTGALVLLDVDHFKAINDGDGHQAGDEVLVALAAAAQAAVREGDMVARLGGDEFALVLPGAALPEARAVADRVLAAAPVAVSMGVTPLTADPRATVLAADRALYEAKIGGRGRVVVTS